MALGSLFPAIPEMHSFLFHSFATSKDSWKVNILFIFWSKRREVIFGSRPVFLVDPKHQIHYEEHIRGWRQTMTIIKQHKRLLRLQPNLCIRATEGHGECKVSLYGNAWLKIDLFSILGLCHLSLIVSIFRFMKRNLFLGGIGVVLSFFRICMLARGIAESFVHRRISLGRRHWVLHKKNEQKYLLKTWGTHFKWLSWYLAHSFSRSVQMVLG